MRSEIYRNNLSALSKRLPKVASAIDSAETGNVFLEQSKSGGWTIRAGERYLVSRYDPVKEVENRAKEFWTDTPDMALFFGFGLGYQFDAMPRQFSGWTIVYEPNPAVCKLAFGVRDFSNLLANPKFLILNDISDLNFDAIKIFGLKVNAKIRTFELFSYRSLFGGLWNEFVDRLEKLSADKDIHQQTLVTRSKVGFEYFFANLPDVLRYPGVEVLRGLFANKPCAIVASGPSLDKNLSSLKRLENRALMIACGSAMKSVLNAGIKPELCIAIETNDVMYQFDSLALDSTYLTLTIRSYPELWRLKSRGFFGFTSTERADFTLLEKFGRSSVLDVGGSVSTAAFELAALMNANPIILVGLDLAYSPSGRSHAEGADTKVEDFYGSFDSKDADEMKKQGIFFVDGYYGGKVPTRVAWMDYLLWFERKIKTASEKRIRVINATEGGARILGAEHLSLSDIANSIDVEFDFLKALDETASNWTPATTKANWEKLVSELGELKQLEDYSDKLHHLYKNAFELTSRFDDLPALGMDKRISKLEKRVKFLAGKLDYLISPFVQSELIVFFNCFEDEGAEERKKTLNLFNRAQYIYLGISKAAGKVSELIEQSFERWQQFENQGHILDDKNLEKTHESQNFAE